MEAKQAQNILSLLISALRQCTYEKNIEICDGNIEFEPLYTCVQASLDPWEQISKDQPKQYFDSFIAESGLVSDWQTDVISGISHLFYKNLALIPEKFHSWKNVLISVAALRDLIGHQYFLLHCSIKKILIVFKGIFKIYVDCYESIVTMVTEGKKYNHISAMKAKIKALKLKRFLALSLMHLFFEYWKDNEDDLRIVLEHLITFELVPIDVVSITIVKFVNMYTLTLFEELDNRQFSDKIEPLDLPDDPLLIFIHKTASAPFEIHLVPTLPGNKPNKGSPQTMFYVGALTFVLLLVGSSLPLVVYLYYMNNICFSNVKT
ncbi:hypothetical protein RF11_02363 [Thelohanellus kitauei]|uniref:Uncharacterized protein n=1 Tax=Thelohanellus kitauei TaxID=669202 RepID=A0A0C2IYC7_THEKT|nr:hypothetical protein RF11_02363 [Thelohanellus kitauei]